MTVMVIILTTATHCESIKEVIAISLVLHKEADILEDLPLHGHAVVVPDGILPREIKLNHILLPILLLVQSWRSKCMTRMKEERGGHTHTTKVGANILTF